MNSRSSIQKICNNLNSFNFKNALTSEIPTFVLKTDADAHNRDVLLQTLPLINSFYDKLRTTPLDEQTIRERYILRKEEYEDLMTELNKPEKVALFHKIKEIENEIKINKKINGCEKIFFRKDLSVKLFNVLIANESALNFSNEDVNSNKTEYAEIYDEIAEFDIDGIEDDEILFYKKIDDFLK